MATDKHKAFTLIELLVVVSIIILLVSILTPTVGKALEQSHRAACAINVREISRGVKAYALTSRLHRGGKPRSLPDANPTTGNWHGPGGNKACLWLLVKNGNLVPQTFICPSLSDFRAAKSSYPQFRDRNCGYSFITMVEQIRTLDNSETSLAICADLNPRFEPGKNTIYKYSDFDHSGSTDSGEQRLANELKDEGRLGNSATHDHDGQTIGRLDGSAAFVRKAFVTTGSNTNDLIYESTTPGNDKEGKSRGPDDVLLLN